MAHTVANSVVPTISDNSDVTLDVLLQTLKTLKQFKQASFGTSFGSLSTTSTWIHAPDCDWLCCPTTGRMFASNRKQTPQKTR